MNKRQVIILWIIAAVLGLSVVVMKLAQNRSTDSATRRSAGETLFEKFPAEQTASIQIKGAGETVTLKKEDDEWTVVERDGYPANTSYVNSFLRDLAELKITQALEAGPSFAPRFGIDENASSDEKHGLIATFTDDSGKEIAKVGIGKTIEQKATSSNPLMTSGGSVGRYVRNFADDSGFYAVSEMFPSVSSEASRWLRSDFFSPEKIISVSLTDKDSGKVAWKLTRKDENAEFDIEGGASDETVNTTTANPLKTLFSYARFDDVVPAGEVEKRAAKKGKQTVVIETADGFTYTIGLIPEKENEDGEKPDTCLMTVDVDAKLPKEREKKKDESEEDAKKADEAFAERIKTLTEKLEKEKQLAGRTFVVSESTVRPVLKERSELITKAEPPKKGESPQETGTVEKKPGGIVHTPPVKAPSSKPKSNNAKQKPSDSKTSDDAAKPKSAATKPIEAVTPPIAVPPLPKSGNEAEKAAKSAIKPAAQKDEIKIPEPPLPETGKQPAETAAQQAAAASAESGAPPSETTGGTKEKQNPSTPEKPDTPDSQE